MLSTPETSYTMMKHLQFNSLSHLQVYIWTVGACQVQVKVNLQQIQIDVQLSDQRHCTGRVVWTVEFTCTQSESNCFHIQICITHVHS